MVSGLTVGYYVMICNQYDSVLTQYNKYIHRVEVQLVTSVVMFIGLVQGGCSGVGYRLKGWGNIDASKAKSKA